MIVEPSDFRTHLERMSEAEGLSEWAISIAALIEPTFEKMHIRMGTAADDLEYHGEAIWRSTEGDGEGKWRSELMGVGPIMRDTP